MSDRGCPCLYTTPCHDRCTCVNSFSSSGCSRCCTYGSLEQRKAHAERLAALGTPDMQDLSIRLNDLVKGLAEQQAMPDDWWKQALDDLLRDLNAQYNPTAAVVVPEFLIRKLEEIGTGKEARIAHIYKTCWEVAEILKKGLP